MENHVSLFFFFLTLFFFRQGSFKMEGGNTFTGGHFFFFIFHFYKLEGIFQLVAGVGRFWSITRYIKGV